MILTDQQIDGKPRKLLIHFDRNGFGYTLDRVNGELLVAEKYDPAVNWATKVDMDKSSPTYGRPKSSTKYSTDSNGEDVNTKGICPAALGTKDEQPAAYSPETKLFYVPTNHVCMDYEPFRVCYTAGQPYVGATLSMYPPEGRPTWATSSPGTARPARSSGRIPEQFSVWSGALATAGRRRVLRHAGRLPEGGRRQDRQGTLQVQDPVRHHRQRHDLRARRQAVCGGAVRRWRLGRHRSCGRPDRSDAGLGAVGGYAALSNYTSLGGTLTVFALPE